MLHLHHAPIPVHFSPLIAVVPNVAGLVPVIHQDGAPLPTWRERCTSESTEVVAVVEGGKAYTVEYAINPGPLPPAPADEILGGIDFEVHANGEVGYCHVDDDGGVSHPGRMFGAALRFFGRTYPGLPMVELALAWINGDTENPQGARLVSSFEIVPPPGWAVVSMTPSDRNAKGGTLEQGRRRDMRVVIVPEAMRSAAERWVEAGAGRALAVDHLGRIVTPHPTGLRWTKPGDAVTQQARQRATAVTVAAFGRSKFPELLAYGTSTEIPSGWQDAIGQPYGGKTGGQQFAPLVLDASALPWTVFAYFETLRIGVADRCLYLTTGGEPVAFDAGLGFAIDMNTGARLFATKGTHPLRAKFVEAVDDPGTVRNSHGSIDWQHGSARFGPAEIMATLWNDPLAKYGLALDAAMARLETTPAEVKAKGGALGRADAWMAHVNALDVMFNGSREAELWLFAFVAGVTAAQRPNGGVCAWIHNKEAKDYARAYVAKRDGVPLDSVPVAPVAQPWQDYAIAHGLRMAHRATGIDVRTVYTRLLWWVVAHCAALSSRIPYRVFLDGTRASDEDDSFHKRHLLGMVAETARDIGALDAGRQTIRALSGVNEDLPGLRAYFMHPDRAPNSELLLGVIS